MEVTPKKLLSDSNKYGLLLYNKYGLLLYNGPELPHNALVLLHNSPCGT